MPSSSRKVTIEAEDGGYVVYLHGHGRITGLTPPVPMGQAKEIASIVRNYPKNYTAEQIGSELHRSMFAPKAYENPMARRNPVPNQGLIGLIESIHYGPPELTLADLNNIEIWINAWRDGSGNADDWLETEAQVEAVRHDLNELIGVDAAYDIEYVGTGRGAQKIQTDDASQEWLAEAEDGQARLEDAYEYDLEDID